MSRSSRRAPAVPLTDAVIAALENAGYDITADPELAAVVEAIRDDKFTVAVMNYRTATGVGLREAKHAVERLQDVLQSGSE